MSLENILDKFKEATTFTKEGKVGGLKFVMRVLSFSEELKLTKIIEEITDEEDFSSLNDWKKHVISMSISSLDGEVVPDVIEVGGERIAKNLYLKEKFDAFPSSIIEALFDVYTDIKDEAEKSIEDGLVYNWFKDPETRKKEDDARAKEADEKRDKEIARISALANLGSDSESNEGSDTAAITEQDLEDDPSNYDGDVTLEKVNA